MKKVPLVFLLMFASACIRQSVKNNTNFAAGQPMPSPTAPSIAAAPTPLAKPTLYPLSCSAPLPKRVSQILLEIKELQKQGFEMQSLRDENDLQSAEKCSRLMEKYQTKARNLGEKSEICRLLTIPSWVWRLFDWKPA